MIGQTASELAKQWCEKNPKWQRICDTPGDSGQYLLAWDELPNRDRRWWEVNYPGDPESAWREFASNTPYRIRYGFIGEDGQFYDCILKMPRLMNSMMVFQTGGPQGIYYAGGMRTKSSKEKARGQQ